MAGFQDSPFGQLFYRYFAKTGETPKMNAVMLNRYCSFHNDKEVRALSYKIDRYTFKLYDKEWLLHYMFDMGIGRQSVPFGLFKHYIKKPEEVKSKFDIIFNKLQQRYHWSDNELNRNKPFIEKILEDKIKLRKILDDIGADFSIYKKFDMEIKPMVKKNEGLGRFFK